MSESEQSAPPLTARAGRPAGTAPRGRGTGHVVAARTGRSVAPSPTSFAAAPSTPRRRSVGRTVLSAVVMAFATAIVATAALPSYAFDPAAQAAARSGAAASRPVGGGQSLTVGADVEAVKAAKPDRYRVTSQAELRRAEIAQQFSSYRGPSAYDYVKNPKFPDFSLASVFATASKYQGVPYVLGGADPSGFDCSGFIMFVYAQYGVALPHSVHQQDAIGVPIAEKDAVPGDVVVFNDDSHDGFYAGNGMILHAPMEGRTVTIQPLWSSDVHFIRLGT